MQQVLVVLVAQVVQAEQEDLAAQEAEVLVAQQVPVALAVLEDSVVQAELAVLVA